MPLHGGAPRRAEPARQKRSMVADAFRLMLFPAMMAFAASTDLLTMTISNRVSLILVGGFFALALAVGMSGADILWHVGAACVVLFAAFGFFARGSAAATPSSRRRPRYGWASIISCPISSSHRCSAGF
jgi:hypothetical protein